MKPAAAIVVRSARELGRAQFALEVRNLIARLSDQRKSPEQIAIAVLQFSQNEAAAYCAREGVAHG